jgi:hypothetical protein
MPWPPPATRPSSGPVWPPLRWPNPTTGSSPRARAQAIARVPDDVVYGLPRCLGGGEVVDDRFAPMGAGGHERKAGDHTGDLIGQDRPVGAVGPAHVTSLDAKVELVANVRTGWP